MTGRSPAATLRLALWSCGLVLACRALLWLGGGALSIPLSSPGDLRAWAAETPPAVMAMAVLRAAGIAACAHLFAVTVAGVLARLLHRRRLADVLDRATPALARRLVIGGSSAGLVVGALAGAAPVPLDTALSRSTVATGPAPADTRATMVGEARRTGVQPEGGAAATMTGHAGAGATAVDHDPGTASASATMTGVAGRADAPHRGGRPDTAMSADPPRAAAPPLPTLDPATWEVTPGDSLWAIADDVVRTDAPTADERDVTTYWRRLVAANRDRLVDPDNPDLLVPGQLLALPPTGTP